MSRINIQSSRGTVDLRPVMGRAGPEGAASTVQGPEGPEGPEGPQGLPGTNAIENDEAVAAYVSTAGTSATKTAVTTLAERIADTRAKAAKRETGSAPEMVIQTLMWTPDEPLSEVDCSIGRDRVNFKVGDRGIKMVMSSATSGRVVMDPMQPQSPLSHPPASAVGLWVWLADASKVTNISVDVRTLNADTTTTTFSRNITHLDRTPRDGWNLLRWPAHSGAISEWQKINYCRVSVVTNAATTATIGHLWLECPRKAQLIMICDGAHRSFYENLAVPFYARGLPITWATGSINTDEATALGPEVATKLTVPELLALQEQGDMVSFHNYGSSTQIMATASKTEVRWWTSQAQKWLQSKGFHGWPFRSAWLQNDAPNAAAAYPLLAAAPTKIGSSTLNAWPLTDRMNYPRITLHGRSAADITDFFAKLKKTHQLGIFYTHEVLTTGGFGEGGANLTVAERDHFLAEIDAAIAEGWLEGTTLEQLFARAGARWRQTFSGPVYEFTDEYGETVALGAGPAQSTPVDLGPFDPLILSNTVIAWWSPANTGAADGATLTSWPDLSERDNPLTTVIGTPTYDADGLNGTPGVVFDGSSALSVTLDQPTGTGGLTVLMNVKANAVGSVSRTALDGDNVLEFYASNVSDWRMRRSSGTSVVAASPAADTAVHTFILQFNAQPSNMDMDGSQIATGVLANNSQAVIHLGQRAAGTNRWEGVIGDVVIVAGILSAAEKADAYAWMRGRIGL